MKTMNRKWILFLTVVLGASAQAQASTECLGIFAGADLLSRPSGLLMGAQTEVSLFNQLTQRYWAILNNRQSDVETWFIANEDSILDLMRDYHEAGAHLSREAERNAIESQYDYLHVQLERALGSGKIKNTASAEAILKKPEIKESEAPIEPIERQEASPEVWKLWLSAHETAQPLWNFRKEKSSLVTDSQLVKAIENLEKLKSRYLEVSSNAVDNDLLWRAYTSVSTGIREYLMFHPGSHPAALVKRFEEADQI